MIQAIGKRASQWGEGPLWDQQNQVLWYVDIEGESVVCYDPISDTEECWQVGQRVGSLVLRNNRPGLILAGDQGISVFYPDSGEQSPLVNPEPGKSTNRLNDGKCDPRGRFFVGSISLAKIEGDAALYRFDPDYSLHPIREGVTNSNGIGWTSDGRTMFYIDTPTRKLLLFDYEPEAAVLSNERVAIDFSAIGVHGSPDGLAVDTEGMVWVAICHGGLVIRVDPHAHREISRIAFPCIETTACAFGGQNLDQLFVTTGIKADLREQDAGRLFVADPGVRGVPQTPFGG